MKGLVSFVACVLFTLVPPAGAEDPVSIFEEFDSWVFQSLDDPSDPVATLQTQCDLELSRISQSLHLREDQMSLLRLAGQGDIKRFCNRLERARHQFLALHEQRETQPDEPQDDPLGDEDISKAYELAIPLHRDLREGLFGRGSLLYKVAANSLEDHQTAVLEQQSLELSQLRTQSAVRAFVAKLGRRLAFTSKQRTALTDVLLKSIKSIETDGYLAYYVVLFRFSEIPREHYESLFDEHQREAIIQLTKQGPELEQLLEQEGVLRNES